MARLGLVLLDRDGVINADSPDYIKSVDEWRPLPGSLEALADLTRAGATLAVVTNQSGVGRGLFTVAALERIHARLRSEVEAAGGRIAGIYYCPHRPDEGCDCRKPAPGLLVRAAAELGQGLAGSPFIGDKPSDVAAARSAGARPILVGPRADRAVAQEGLTDVEWFPNLAAAARALILEAGG